VGSVHLGILTEVGGKINFKDIVEGENVREETDKVTGLTQMVIVESAGGREADADPHHQGEEGARRRSTSCRPAHSWCQRPGRSPGRHSREDPPRHDQDQGHHRRSAARRRALRSAPSARQGGHHRGRRNRPSRRDRQGHAQDHRRDRRGNAVRVLGAAVRSRQRAGRRARRAGDPLIDGPIDPHDVLAVLGVQGAAALPGRQDPGGLPLAVGRHQRQAHRGHRAGRCCARSA
jgi:DNA-directed RNA polymerase subunit beta'